MRAAALSFAAALVVPALLATLGCRHPEAPTEVPEEVSGEAPPKGPTASPIEQTPVDLSTWRSESLDLPPPFAPLMPAGREVVHFAPGWSDPEAEDHWTYAVLMEIEEASIDAERLTEIFELNYDGLIGAVGGGKGLPIPEDPAQVTFERTGEGSFKGTVKTFDAFSSGDPLTLHLLLQTESLPTGSSTLRLQASPVEPAPETVWSSLGYVAANLQFNN